jgi:hypothetical protein
MPRTPPAGILVILTPAATGLAPDRALGRELCLGSERDFRIDLVRALALALGRFAAFGLRFAAEPRFFIFLRPLDLGFFLERFPAMNDSSLGDDPHRLSEAA